MTGKSIFIFTEQTLARHRMRFLFKEISEERTLHLTFFRSVCMHEQAAFSHSIFHFSAEFSTDMHMLVICTCSYISLLLLWIWILDRMIPVTKTRLHCMALVPLSCTLISPTGPKACLVKYHLAGEKSIPKVAGSEYLAFLNHGRLGGRQRLHGRTHQSSAVRAVDEGLSGNRLIGWVLPRRTARRIRCSKVPNLKYLGLIPCQSDSQFPPQRNTTSQRRGIAIIFIFILAWREHILITVRTMHHQSSPPLKKKKKKKKDMRTASIIPNLLTRPLLCPQNRSDIVLFSYFCLFFLVILFGMISKSFAYGDRSPVGLGPVCPGPAA